MVHGRWGCVALTAAFLLGGCAASSDPADPTPSATLTSPSPSPSPSTPPSTPAPSPSPSPTPSLDAEDLAGLCDTASGPDDRCFSTRYGNNLRALEGFLDGVEEWGGVRETTVTAQGLTAAPVGGTVDMLTAVIPLDLGTEVDAQGSCTAAFDGEAQLGVVSVTTPGPRGDVEVVQAYLIANPVVRTSDDLGLGSTLAHLRDAHPDLEVGPTGDGSVAFTPVEEALEQLAAPDSRRTMLFRLDETDRVVAWAVGVPTYAVLLCSRS